MANELRVFTELDYSKSGRKLPVHDSFFADASGDEYTFQRQSVGTAAEEIDIGSDVGTKGLLYIKNLDASNYVLVGSRCYKLAWDNESVALTEGLKVTGGSSSATGWILYKTATDVILTDVNGTFENNEALTDSGSGSVLVNGTIASVSPAFFAKLKAGESALVRVAGNDALMTVANSSACIVEYFLVED
jgi:hypothetical protein|tara:strand:+ start:28 stop:597 length:570 start_codon:yes stop_codon:yes gene_type:complete